MLAVKLYSKYPRVGGTLRADWSLVHQGLVITTGPRGFEECSFFVPMDRAEARTWFGRSGATHIQVNDSGHVVYEGRAEIVSTLDGPPSGLAITALGYWRAFSDAMLNTEWSSVDMSRWQPIETAQLAGRVPDEWNFTSDDKLMISAVSGGVFDSSRGGAMYFTFGNTVSRTIQTLDASYSLTAPAGWVAFVQAFIGPFTGGSNPWTLGGNGATQTGTIALSSLGAHTIAILLLRNRAGTTMHAVGGTAYAAGAAVVITPAVMPAGLVKGNKVWLGGADPEEVVLAAVTATTFTCKLEYAHTGADAVSWVSEHKEGDIRFELTNVRVKATNSSTVTASEVLAAVLTDINASNPGHISASAALVGNPGVDLKEFAYDGYPDAVIDQLATMGDANNNPWTAEVYEDQVLRFRREDSIAAVYQIMQTPELSRDLDLFRSHIIPRYQDANGDVAQATTQANLIAASRAGVVRSAFFEAPEVDSVAAVNALAATALLDTASPAPMGDITVTELFRDGQRVPLYRLRKGDIVECVEFPSSGSQAVDSARRLRVSATSYDHDAQTLTISPTLPASTIEALLARRDTQEAVR